MTTTPVRKPESCPECGEQLFIVQGCTEGDRDAMRNNRWCEECKTLFACHAHGLSKRLILMDEYRGDAAARIKGFLKSALAELEGK